MLPVRAVLLAGIIPCSACTPKPAEPVDSAMDDPVDWPAIDTTEDCPAVDFTAEGSFAVTSDVVYDQEDGEDLLLDLYLPDAEGPRPGIVMVHGGGFTSGDRGYMAAAAEHYAAAGFVVLNVEYRRVPTHGLDALTRDVVCSVKWALAEADTIGLNRACLGTIGESAGGYLASMASLAGSDPLFTEGCDTGGELDALTRWSVPYYGIADLPAFEAADGLGVLMPWLAELAGLTVEALSPTSYVARDPSVGFYLPHGTEDDVVPPSQSEVFHGVLEPAGHPTQLRLMPGVGHGFVAGGGFWGEDNQAIQADIEDFVQQMNRAR
ncbi:MAG TPA: hypothetical protein DFR83_24855 [Deltaproteobacteria bacterium]|nr:hypothetical protein [Deltaproteobacteria bacterium]